ncbi:MAG: acetyl-CoA C-acyltransferase [Deltaproteobacteria bacterium]|nr:acetyl-CoA C-acyltransferase [Deltaproteobacteria bacterium]
MSDVYILDAVRTPRGKRNGSLAHTHPIDLATVPLEALVERNKFNPADVSDVIYGCVSQRGEQDNVIAREAVLAAGWPLDVAGVTLNRFCGSGLTAVNWAAQAVMSGQEDLMVAGGVEHMTRVPMNIDFNMVGSKLAAKWPNLIPQGLSAEMISDRYHFSRSQLDEFAARSQKLAAQAWEQNRFEKSIVSVKAKNAEGAELIFTKDEHLRPSTTVESLSNLKPSFKENGTIHAGNSSGIVDGASAVLLASPQKTKELGLKPRAKIISTAVAGDDPIIMLLGPIPTVKKALKKVNLKVDDIDLWEINEAFAPVPLAVAQDLKIDLNKVKVNGGAIALGHPLGATGAMLLGTLLDEMERQDKRYGCVTLCIGHGMGVATIIDRKI